MRFPGHRNPKHYFPITKKTTGVCQAADGSSQPWYLLGLDEVLIDVQVRGDPEQFGLVPGESVHLSPSAHRQLLDRLAAEPERCTFAAGGTVANTLENFTHLSGEPAVLLGAIQHTIHPSEPAFGYVAQTPKAIDLGHLRAVEGDSGMVFTFIAPDGDRTFGVAPGIAGDYPVDAIPEAVVRGAAVVLTTLYCLWPPDRPIAAATERVMKLAHDAGVPVAFGLGTAHLVRKMRRQVQTVLETYVTIAAMNIQEATALTGETDALVAAEAVLEWVDAVIITEGPRGLTLSGYTDERVKRQTREQVRSKAIPEYNRWEFSRLMRRKDCEHPLKIHSHIHPYLGGPDQLGNTSGAGDAALAALLHDITANQYHRATVPQSPKHAAPVRFLTYSSLSRNAQYSNRVAYEVLTGHSPRLSGRVGPDAAEPEWPDPDVPPSR